MNVDGNLSTSNKPKPINDHRSFKHRKGMKFPPTTRLTISKFHLNSSANFPVEHFLYFQFFFPLDFIPPLIAFRRTFLRHFQDPFGNCSIFHPCKPQRLSKLDYKLYSLQFLPLCSRRRKGISSQIYPGNLSDRLFCTFLA
jgi:hypothetical protein